MNRVLTEDALLECEFGTTHSHFIKIKNTAVTYDGKNIILENNKSIGNFTFCTLHKKRCTVKPIGDWSEAACSLLEGKKRPLLSSSCLMCAKGGIISIKYAGDCNIVQKN